MKRVALRTWLGWILILLSLSLLIWGFYPMEHKRRELRIAPQELQLPGIQEINPHEIRRV
jgi:hypothetical protein